MKRTQRIEAVRNIRRNKVSFLSIVIISMLAVTAYLGLDFSAEGMKRSADATYAEENFADIEISSSALFAEKDLETVRAAEGVTDAEGIMYLKTRVSGEDNTLDVEIRSVPERISLPHLLEGKLPGAADECAVEKTLAGKMGYGIGDRVCLTGRSSLTDRLIVSREYTVTGVFTTADHLTEMISFEPALLVTREAFDTRLLPRDRFTRILVRIETDEPYRFTDAWRDSAEKIKGRLEPENEKWIVTGLHNSASYISMKENAGMLSTVSITFSMLFVLIAALVIYSTIGRLVDHESRLVGATKAMGLKNSEIVAKYLMFGAGGAFTGAVLGILTAYFVFERLVLYFFGTVFLFSKQVQAFRTVPVLVVAAGAAALGFAAVFLACGRLMRSTAVTLMSGQNAVRKSGRKTSSGSGALYIRLMLRNMRTDWKRVLVSIVSIAGCCMLMMIGFSLKYAISRVPERQYGEIQRFGTEIALDPSARPEAMDRIRNALEEEGIPHAGIYTAETPYKAGGDSGLLTLICPDDGEDLSDYYRFSDAATGEALAIPESGVLVSRKFADEYSLEAGSRFRLYDSGMDLHDAETAGIFENYIGINAACSKAYAEECLGEKPAANTVLLLRDPQDPDALRKSLEEIDGFISLTSSRKQEALYNGISSMLNLVILLLGALAVMIACFILLNLVSTYVNQKKNELTIMRINGYTTGETIRYASMECYGITALGILLGLAAGQAFSSFLIRLIEQTSMGFVKEPLWISFAASAVITAVISGVIHFFAFRQIRDLKLSDIQK